jgi:hypothetical protein
MMTVLKRGKSLDNDRRQITVIQGSAPMGKSETRSTKFETISKTKIQMLKTEWCKSFVLNFLFNSFGFVSGFEIRISNFWGQDWIPDPRLG